MAHAEHIRLDAVLEEPSSFAFELPFSVEALGREPLLEISPVKLEGTIGRIEGGFRLEARCAFESRLECSRCLASYPSAVDETFSLLLYPRGTDGKTARGEEAETVEFEGNDLAVAPLAEERVQLSIPMKPLCREDCLGLCPRCGTDRNAGACGCRDEAVDPRWGVLETLRNPNSQKA